MSAPTLCTLASVAHSIPFEIKTLYNAHSAGRLPWLTRTGPEGRRTRELWVIVELFNAWAAARGMSITLNEKGGVRRH